MKNKTNQVKHTVCQKQVGNNIQVCKDEIRVISWPSQFKHLLFETTEGLLRNTLISYMQCIQCSYK